MFGYKQSGHIAKVGFEMYCNLLQEAVDETIGSPDKKQPPKISVPVDALLDSEYIQLVQDRLYFYQQLSETSLVDRVDEIEEELKDRFGNLPKSAKNLLNISKIRIQLTGSSISMLSVIGSELIIKLSDFKPYNSSENLINSVSQVMELNNRTFRFASSADGFTITVGTKNIEQAIKDYGKAIYYFPENHEYFFNRAIGYQNLEQLHIFFQVP